MTHNNQALENMVAYFEERMICDLNECFLVKIHFLLFSFSRKDSFHCFVLFLVCFFVCVCLFCKFHYFFTYFVV